MRMVASKTLRVSPDSELSVSLHDALASHESLVVDTGDARYRLDIASAQPIEPSTPGRPTPEETERSRAGIREAAGSWRDIDTDAFKAYIRERRWTGSRPPVEL